jgi:hypothetical protein
VKGASAAFDHDTSDRYVAAVSLSIFSALVCADIQNQKGKLANGYRE